MPETNSQVTVLARSAAVVALVTLLGGAFPPLAASASPEPSPVEEYRLKAALLYRFAQFVQWPADPRKPADRVALCVLGKNPFGEALNVLDGRQVAGRPLRVRQLGRGDGLDPCHLLFVSASEEGRLESILRASERAGLLTVGDMERFAERGGIIGLVTVERRIRFDIHLHAARGAGLDISSRLLALARKVYGLAEREVR